MVLRLPHCPKPVLLRLLKQLLAPREGERDVDHESGPGTFSADQC